MALNPLYTIDQLPTTTVAALREFNERYLALLMSTAPTGWADRFGTLVPTSSGYTTFPISQLGVKYTRANGEDKARTMGEKSFSLKTEKFDAGYEAKWEDIQKAFGYRRWQAAPQSFLNAEANFRHKAIAALLEAGESTAYLDTGVNFFSATHPCNLFDTGPGTFSNYQSSTKSVLSVANIQAEIILMAGVKDENGDKMGVVPDTILVPTDVAEPLRNMLAKEYLSTGALSDVGNQVEPNPYKGRFEVVEVKEFTDVNDWYLVDSKLVSAGYDPWIMLKESFDGRLALRQFDENTDFFLNTQRLKVVSEIRYGFGLGLPHAIRKIKGA